MDVVLAKLYNANTHYSLYLKDLDWYKAAMRRALKCDETESLPSFGSKPALQAFTLAFGKLCITLLVKDAKGFRILLCLAGALRDFI